MPSPPRLNVFYYIAGGLAALFAVTIMASLASLLGDPRAPVTRFLDAWGTLLLLGEVAGILLAGFAALVCDRPSAEPAEQSADFADQKGKTEPPS